MSISIAEKLAERYHEYLKWAEDLDEQSVDEIIEDLKPMMEHDLEEAKDDRHAEYDSEQE